MKVNANTLPVGQLVRALEVVHRYEKTPELKDALDRSGVMMGDPKWGNSRCFTNLMEPRSNSRSMNFLDGVDYFQLVPALGALPRLDIGFNISPIPNTLEHVQELSLTFDNAFAPGHMNNKIEVALLGLTERNIKLDCESFMPLETLADRVRLSVADARFRLEPELLADTAKKFVRAVNGAIVFSNKKLRKEREEHINDKVQLPFAVTTEFCQLIDMVKGSNDIITTASGSSLSFRALLGSIGASYSDSFYINSALFVAYNVNPSNPKRSKSLGDFVVSEEFFNKEIMPRVNEIDTRSNESKKRQAAVELLESVRKYYIELGQVPPIIAA